MDQPQERMISMKCKNCGADISMNEEKCPYCRSYIDHPIQDRGMKNDLYAEFSQRPPIIDPFAEIRREAERNAGNALVFGILGLVLGIFIIRIVFGILGLYLYTKAKKGYSQMNMAPDRKLIASLVLSIIAIALGVILFFGCITALSVKDGLNNSSAYSYSYSYSYSLIA